MAKFDPDKNPAYIIFFAAVASAVFTASIMAVYVATKPTVERKQKLLTQRSMVDIFALGDVETMTDQAVIDVYEKYILAPNFDQGETLYYAWIPDLPGASISPDARPSAVGVPIGGVGFWAPIRGYLAVDIRTPSQPKTLGVVFLEQSETPGLGGRITERAFREQFTKGLNLAPPAGEGKYIYINKNAAPADKTDPEHSRHVDAVTGATLTSKAVDEFVNENLKQRLAEALKQAAARRYSDTLAATGKADSEAK